MAFSDHVKMIIGADSKGFQTELSEAEGKVKTFKDNVSRFLAGALGTAAFTKASTAVVDYATQIGNMSNRLGVSADFLQSFQYAANQTGIKTEAAATALQRFTRRVQEAKDNGGPLKDTLDKLNIQLTKSDGTAKNTEAVFKEFANALRNMENPAEKVKTAFQFLDTEGVGLVQTFRKGEKTLKEFGEEAGRLGLKLDQETIQKLTNAEAEFLKLKQGIMVTLAQGLTPLLEKISKITPLLGTLAKGIASVASEIALAGAAFVAFLAGAKIAAWAKATIVAIQTITAGATGLKAAFIALNTVMKVNPFIAITTAVISIGVAFKSFIDDTANASVELEKLANEKLKKAQAEFNNTKDKVALVTAEIKKLKSALKGVEAKKVELTNVAQIKLLRDANAELKKQKKILEEQEKAALNQLAVADDILDNLIAQEAEAGEIAAQEAKAEAINLKRLTIGKNILQTEIDMEANLKKIVDLKEKEKQENIAIAIGMDQVIKKHGTTQLALERELELQEAIAKGDAKRVEDITKKHELQDLIVKLMDKEKLSVQEADILARKLLDTREKNRKKLGDLKQAQDDVKQAIKEAKDEVEKKNLEQDKVNVKLAQELALRAQAKQAAQLQIQALQARAAGNVKLAQQLEKQKDFQDQIKQIMQQQGVTLQNALDQLKQKADLQNDIAVKAAEENAKEEAMNEVRELAAKDLGDIRDRNDKARARDARAILRLEQRIAREKGKIKDELAQDLDAKVTAFISDTAKDDLNKLARDKLQIADTHQVHLNAIAQAGAAIAQQQADAAAQVALEAGVAGVKMNEMVAQIADKNAAAVDGMQAVGDGAIQAVGDVGKKMEASNKEVATELGGITNALNTMNLSEAFKDAIADLKPPIVNNAIVINLESDLRQETQEAILETLQGFFVNQ